MLYSIVLEIKDTQEYLKKKNYNYALYAWFLQMIEKNSPELSEKLHESQQTLFTISPFFKERE
ncbi:MAG: hypothetical protein M0Q02_08310, partial [Candidatus Muirbacterium halophilum]|nr:hypothetical protein [Candidatus Muirbacterium halophilum]